MHELPFAQFVEAGEQGREGVGLVVVMPGTHHAGLDGLQDIQEDGLTLIAFNVRQCQLLGWLLGGARGAGRLPFLLQLQIAEFLQLPGCWGQGEVGWIIGGQKPTARLPREKVVCAKKVSALVLLIRTPLLEERSVSQWWDQCFHTPNLC